MSGTVRTTIEQTGERLTLAELRRFVEATKDAPFALALVAAEMARLLDVYADGADSMEHKQEAADALDAFRSLRRVALAELINTTGRSL